MSTLWYLLLTIHSQQPGLYFEKLVCIRDEPLICNVPGLIFFSLSLVLWCDFCFSCKLNCHFLVVLIQKQHHPFQNKSITSCWPFRWSQFAFFLALRNFCQSNLTLPAQMLCWFQMTQYPIAASEEHQSDRHKHTGQEQLTLYARSVYLWHKRPYCETSNRKWCFSLT